MTTTTSKTVISSAAFNEDDDDDDTVADNRRKVIRFPYLVPRTRPQSTAAAAQQKVATVTTASMGLQGGLLFARRVESDPDRCCRLLFPLLKVKR